MPANAGARPIFIYQHLCEGFGRPSRKGCNLFAQRQQKVRYSRRLHDFAPIIVVTQAKTDDPPVGQMAMEIERLERQSAQLPGEFGFFPWGDQSRLVAKTFRQIVDSTKEILLKRG